MAGPIRYAYLDEAPVVFDNDQAFEFTSGKWVKLPLPEAQTKAKLLHVAEFTGYAGKLAVETIPLPVRQ